jgi:hypothetical protein
MAGCAFEMKAASRNSAGIPGRRMCVEMCA